MFVCAFSYERACVCTHCICTLLSTPMGVDYVVIGFDMEVQPLVTHNAARPLCLSGICIDVVSNRLLFAHMP